MKAIEILSEHKRVDEAPAGMIGQAAKRIGAGLLSAAGLKTWAGQINDKADVGTFANRYSREFDGYLKTAGRTADSATLGDLKDFMAKTKIPDQNVPNNLTGSADKQMVNAILTKTAQDVLKGIAASAAGKDATAAANTNTPSDTTGTQPVSQPGQTSQPASNQQTAPNSSQPFSIPALLQVIPQMKKKDLNKILTATQTALQNPTKAASNAATAATTVNTSNMTPAQIRATKQAAAANVAQAQMKANVKPAVAAPQTPAEIRVAKQAAATAAARAQMNVAV